MRVVGADVPINVACKRITATRTSLSRFSCCSLFWILAPDWAAIWRKEIVPTLEQLRLVA